MLKNIVTIITSLLLLAGCADGFKGYFKKSANNKWIDSKGFQGGKRKPLYNKKYISMAKRNVAEENFDDDEDYDDDEMNETPSISRTNKEMYIKMLNRDAELKKREKLEQYKKSFRSRKIDNDSEYPSLIEANQKVNNSIRDNQDVQKELYEIKEMLNEARKDLTRYKCPMENEPVLKNQINNSKPIHNENVIKPKIMPKKNNVELEEKLSSDEDGDVEQIILKNKSDADHISHEI